MVAAWAFSSLTWLLAIACVVARPSLDVLGYYEALDYDPAVLRTQHHRVIRDASKPVSEPVHLHINAFNRSFVSSLSHFKGVFGESVQFLVGGVKTDEYDPRSFYGGALEGEPGSVVRGHIIDGVFDGVIHSTQGTYHIEQAHRFFSGQQDFHSIIYHSGDMHVPESLTSCGGAKGQLIQQLNELASTAIPLHDDKNMVYGEDRHSRLRRQTINNRRFCPVRVAADHLYLASVGGGSVVNTMSQIVAVISDVQDIYSGTDFSGSGVADNIQPVIVSLEVLDQNARGYPYGATNILVNNFLDLWSQEDQTQFCLALLLTHRDFADGVLGLAWVAQPSGGNSGGICEDRVRIRTGERSLNTAIVTFLNFGRTQPRSVATITIAHEFGHNFGSPHDPSGSCSPGGSQGNFIMFPQATDGALQNNRRFSSCSVNSMRAVLQTESDCFTATEAFCGNGIKEGNEECDCGNMCGQDNCCRDNCTLTPGSQCSTVEPCCNTTCRYQPDTFQCMSQTECGEASFCMGTSGTCPNPDERRGNDFCNEGRNICQNGLCAGSICVNRNATDCQCSITGGNDKSTLCHVCCQLGGTGPCQSSFDLFGPMGGQERDGGRSCNNFEGYCSNAVPPSCIVVDNERTLEDLLDFFNINTLSDISAWLQEYWYVPVIIVIVIAAFVFLLHITYRKRTPIKKGINRVRHSTLRRQQASGVTPSSNQPASNGRRRAREISQGEGERRLKQFFPTADRETIISVMRSTRSESKAVQRMIDLGYPLCKMPLPRS